MTDPTPEQETRLAQQAERLKNLTRQERQTRIMHSWAEEFYKLRQRDDRTFVVFLALLSLNTLLLFLVVS